MSVRNNFDVGSLVWGKVLGSRTWPGIVIEGSMCGMSHPSTNKIWIFWFGDKRISLASISKTYDFVSNFVKFYNVEKAPATFKRGLFDILVECRKRGGLPFSNNRDELRSYIDWALQGFTNPSQSLKIFKPAKGESLPQIVLKQITLIKSSQDSENSNCIDEFPTSASSSDSDSDSEVRKRWQPKAALLKKIRNGDQFLNSMCIGCEKTDVEEVVPHPLFQGGLCQNCKNVHDMNCNYSGSDGINLYCAICCSPGEIFVCDSKSCDKVFCFGCVELFVAPSAIERIRKTDPWFCFLCTSYDERTHGLIIPRSEGLSSQIETENEVNEIELYEDYLEEKDVLKKPLRVLSLFDGIASGLFALDKLKLKVDCYFASEIDENAINVSKMNFGNRIEHIGDVRYLTNDQIEKLCPIDLLIGGSPCNDLSIVNPYRKGLFDLTGTGMMFFHFFRVQKVIEKCNGKDRRLFWFFENVSSMPKECKAQISLFLQRNPIMIDAKYFSPQKRPRYYWGNIPGMYKSLPKELPFQRQSLDDIVLKECNRKANVDILNCVTTKPNSLLLCKGQDFPVTMNGHPDVPWITELEKVFGFPEHYTDVGNLGVRDRQILLGKAWSINVITHVFTGLSRFFTCDEEGEKNEISQKNEHVENVNKSPPSLIVS